MAYKTPYGVQLFKLVLHKGNARGLCDFRKTTLAQDSRTLLDSLRALVPTIYDETRIDDFSYRDREKKDDSESGPMPALRIENISSTSDDRVDIEFRYGRVGSHDLAIAREKGDDAPLDNKASTNLYRASIYFPTSGQAAILMCEARGQSCPSTHVLKALCLHMRDEDLKRPESERRGWWRIMPLQISDSGRLEEVLRQGNGAGLQLEKRTLSANQARGGDVITLRRNGLPQGKLSAVKAMVMGWVGFAPDADEDAAPDGSPVEQVSSLIGVAIQADEFDDGAVTYDQGDGRTQTIRPHSVKDIFTYPVTLGTAPSHADLRDVAEARLKLLQPTLGIQLTL